MKTFEKDNIRVTIKKFANGYLATVDYLDKDGDVEFGYTGEFNKSAYGAAQNALAFFANAFKRE